MTSKRRLIVIGAIVLVACVATLGAVRLIGEDPSRFETAVALAPEGSQRLSWTDWAAVRAELGVDIGAGSPATEVSEMLDDGYDADLTSTSALVTSAPALHEAYGVSPANLEWELLAQGEEGQVLLMGLPESLSRAALEDTLRALGYAEVDDDQGRWRVSVDDLARIGGVTGEFANVRLLPGEHVLVASDDPAFLASWPTAQRDSVSDGISSVVADLAGPVSAVVYSGEETCGALAMGQADGAAGAQADQLLAAAGDVHPLLGYTMASMPGGTVEVRMAFERDDYARTDADTRSALAAGPAPGQGGSFPDRFTVEEVTAEGSVVRMVLEPVDGAYVLSDLSSGPVLFATC